MGRQPFTLFATAGVAALLASGCTMKQAATQSLTGPSGLGTTVSIAIVPDVLTQDGASQSLVTITAIDANGQPARSLAIRSEIEVQGVTADFGSLSARNVVTDTNGKATLVYTAPAAPPLGVTTDTIIQIAITPVGSDFGNELARRASIRLVPPGVVGLPPSPLRPEFAPPAANAGDPAVFSATVVDASGANASNQVSSYAWDFGDAGTASGQTATHTYTTAGTYVVTLRITDTLGRVAVVSHGITVGGGQNPTASFVVSPAPPALVDQTLNFNASGSTAAPGHRIVDFAWNFGDGSLGSGALTSHSYSTPGSYVVTLKVTDDAGRKSALTSQTVTVTSDVPTASFTISPSSPSAPTGTNASVVFDATGSTAVTGRTIVSYSWAASNGVTGSGAVVTGLFAAPGSYSITLTVKDSAGVSSSQTKVFTVTGT